MDKRFWDPERIPEYTASCKSEPKKRAQTISQSPLKTRFPNNSVPELTRKLASLSFLCFCI
ncbi:hypothetical protein NC653_001873 [Populus alba x Populus x berolinensis]|uniref:Uncharacterized protein n=1 Tax=Populus alba x Populus x berolinensis TaxID=444605 RepID=A0AAD6RM72_9ROSI|nr:hypothetical protein NC653_001873 [Populus alba x Populus x berolinensis]